MSFKPSDFMFGTPYAPGLGSEYGVGGVGNGIPYIGAPAMPTGGPTDLTGLAPLAPKAPAGTGLFGGMGTLDKVNLAMSGLQTLGGLWAAFQSAKLAKKQFNFTKDITNTNLANQIQSYNTALADRARSRGVMEGQTSDQVSGYIGANGLSRNPSTPSGSSLSGITAAALSNYRPPNPTLGH